MDRERFPDLRLVMVCGARVPRAVHAGRRTLRGHRPGNARFQRLGDAAAQRDQVPGKTAAAVLGDRGRVRAVRRGRVDGAPMAGPDRFPRDPARGVRGVAPCARLALDRDRADRRGLIGIVLPAVALLVYVAIERDWALLRRLHWAPGLAVFGAIVLPWFVLVQYRN